MIDFIAVKDFSFVFYNFQLLFVLLAYLDSNQFGIDDMMNLKKKNVTGIVLMIACIVYIGLRPITYSHFGDMGMYNYYFERYVAGDKLQIKKDMGFELFLYGSSKIMSAQMFFLTCAFLYIYPLYLACKKFFKEYWYYGFLILIVSFSFWGYGTNGIRNGLATTFFIFALSRTKIWWIIGFMALAVNFHGSLIIPSAAYAITYYYKDYRKYFYFWLLTIPLSAALGGFWETLFTQFGFGQEERLQGYLNEIGQSGDELPQTGFRVDFILYSASAVIAAWFYLFKKKYHDELYIQMVNIYLIANGFWILVIRANFSNRFAYLSWFMLGLIIIYPLLKVRFYHNQHRIIGITIVAYFAFTYLMNVILA